MIEWALDAILWGMAMLGGLFIALLTTLYIIALTITIDVGVGIEEIRNETEDRKSGLGGRRR